MKKVIKYTTMVSSPAKHIFMHELQNTIDNLQTNGLEVEIHYDSSEIFSAVIAGYSME